MSQRYDLHRRSLLAGVSSLTSAGIGGCIINGDGGGAANNRDGNSTSSADEGEDVELVNSTRDLNTSSDLSPDDRALVQPTVVSVRHPEPQGVSVDQERQSGDVFEFSATVENTGMSGDIGLTLVFLENPGDDPYATGSKKVRTIRRYFSEGERRTVTVSARTEAGYGGYAFRLWAGVVEVDVENTGGPGEAEVKLVNEEGLGDHDVRIDDKTVSLAGGETKTVHFEDEYDNFLFENLSVEASRVE